MLRGRFFFTVWHAPVMLCSGTRYLANHEFLFLFQMSHKIQYFGRIILYMHTSLLKLPPVRRHMTHSKFAGSYRDCA
ncbi:hypothetical protein EDC04DRAFT_56493 [Pisolithus marmoratus]|nr:hypothetical protein EDC04DRAFT_56493 [Pisolithus marmoratus]